jgi:hypothetical protein
MSRALDRITIDEMQEYLDRNNPSFALRVKRTAADMFDPSADASNMEDGGFAAASSSLRPTDDISVPQLGMTLMAATPFGDFPATADDVAATAADPSWLNFALTGIGAALPFVGGLAAARRGIDSRTPSMYNLQDRPLTPVEADYPSGIPMDASGNLTESMDGVPLGARFIVGRSTADGSQQAVTTEGLDAVTAAGTGRSAQIVPKSQLGAAYGRVDVNRYSRMPERVFVAKGLTPNQHANVYAHEVAHVIDQAAGEIPVSGLSAEMRPLYNYLNTGQDRTKNLTEPKHFKYTGDDIPREYMAEAIRAYMSNPNSFKKVAPKTAERIRKAVNTNEKLKGVIQFNAAAPFLGVGMSEIVGDDVPERD